MSSPPVMSLDVQLHGVSIGTILRTSGDVTTFSFNQRYIDNPLRDTLGLSFKTAAGALRTVLRSHQTRLMPFFSNLLPEGPLREYLAERGGVHPEREFFLLRLLGEDLPGALRVRPLDGTGLSPAPAGDDAVEDGNDLPPQPAMKSILRFSLAGVQLKFSGVLKQTGGLTIPARGVGGSWIVKLPSDRFEDVPENEYSMMSLARLTGITVPRTKLVPMGEIENLPSDSTRALKGRHVLAVERFDRASDGAAVHAEDFAQVFDVYPRDKYGRASSMNIAQVLGIEAHNEDVAEFIRRLVFNALIGNADMHVKNWSVIYPDRRRARLSPGYDFLNTTSYLPDEKAGLKLSRTRKYAELTLDELKHLAGKAKIPGALVLEAATQTVDLFHQVWSREKAHLPLSPAVIKAVEVQLKQIPLAQPGGG